MKIFLITNYSSQFLAVELQRLGHDVTITGFQELEALRFNERLLDKALECDCVVVHFTSAQLVVDKLSGGLVSNTVKRIKEVSKILTDSFKHLPKIYIPTEDVHYFPNGFDKEDYSYHEAVVEVNSLFVNIASQHNNILITPVSVLPSDINLKTYVLSGCPYNWSFYNVIAAKISHPLRSTSGGRLKGIILDLDNTCWEGVVGDLGVSGVRCRQDDGGEMFMLLQQFVKLAFEAGILLAISSKNELKNVIEALNSEKVIISEEMFTHIKANWEPKDMNIAKIVADWNISTEDILFLDDNPTERSLVRLRFKDMIIPDWNDLGEAFSFMSQFNIFIPREITQDDRQRTMFFKAEERRAELSLNSQSYDEFLKGLNIKMSVTLLNEDSISRVEQLFQKTNQFNSFQKRFSRLQLINRIRDKKLVTLVCSVEDIYSKYGIVSAIALSLHDNELHVDNWVMSCRVFKKNIELEILRVIGELALSKGCTKVCVHFNLTDRNALVQEFFDNYLIFKRSSNLYEGNPDKLVVIKTNVECIALKLN